MKKFLFIKLSFAMFLLLGLASCKKQETKVYLEATGTAPVLSSNVPATDTLILLQADSTDAAVAFTWTNPNYTFSNGISSQDVTYNLEFDTTGDNFQNPKIPTMSFTSDLGTSLTEGQLDKLLFNDLGFSPGSTQTVQVRVQSFLSPSTALSPDVQLLNSNVLTFKVVPYKSVVIYDKLLWVPGQYQNWSPNVAVTIAYATPYNTTGFEGYVNFPGSGQQPFKFTSGPDFAHVNFGDAGGDFSLGTNGGGNLSTDGGAGNLNLPNAGYYRFDVDTVGLTWTYDATTWGVIGSFAPSNWGTDVPMTYDVNRKEWWTIVTLSSTDQFKFRANADWNNPKHNFGVDGSNNLQYNGSNITVPSAVAGVDTVFLDLHVPGYYVYSIVKQ